MSTTEADLLARLDPRRRAALEEVWAATAHLPKDGSITDELIAERRAEAAAEDVA